MDRFCASCGKQLQADQEFCTDCGAAWGPTAASPIPNAVPAAPPAAPAAAPLAPQASSKKSLLVVALAIILAMLGAGAWFATGPHGGATSAAVSSSSTVGTSSGSVDAPAVTASSSILSPADETAAAAATRPCSFITEDQMGQILGLKVVRISANETSCSYYTDLANPDYVATLDFIWTGAKAEYETKKGLEGDNAHPIADLGDDAYMQAAGVLHVLKGDIYVQVNSRTLPDHDVQEVAIARKVLETLK